MPPRPRLADVAAATSDELLAAAAEGLDFLDAALARRAALAEAAGLPRPPARAHAVRARIDRLRGIDFTGLAARAEDLRAAATGLRDRHRALAEEAGVLWESWSGPGADDVAGRVVALARAAHAVVGVLEEIADRIEDAAVAVADAVGRLASAAATLPDATPLPDPDDAPGDDARRARRRATADLDARVHALLRQADATDATLAAVWADLADRMARLRAMTSAPDAAAGTDPDADAHAGTGPDLVLPDPVLDALLADLALPVPSAVDPLARPVEVVGPEQLGPRDLPEPDGDVRPWRPRGGGPPAWP